MMQLLNRLDKIAAQVAIKLIRVYQLTLSAVLGRQCKFYPTCSSYGIEAYQLHGGAKGTWLTVKRLLRCNPFSQGGVDLVPEPSDKTRSNGTNNNQENMTHCVSCSQDVESSS